MVFARLVKSFLLLGALALSFSHPIASAADKSADKFNLIQVQDLKRLMADSKIKLTILDANNQNTRAKDGVIPGAIMLSSFSDYDIAKELPADKESQLVFYCANPRCTASHTAAERAVGAGYQHVSVLSDGIQGWAAAGEETAHPLS